jgi:hypothetical protein
MISIVPFQENMQPNEEKHAINTAATGIAPEFPTPFRYTHFKKKKINSGTGM